MPQRPELTPRRIGRAASWVQRQRGGFVLGMVVGLLVGLAAALAVALYVTKVPIPFIDKVPLRSAEQDASEQQRNKSWEPNAPLASKAPRPGSSASGVVVPASGAGASAPEAAASTPPRDPAAILAGAALPVPPPGMAPPPPAAKAGGDPYVYFVQAGAFQRPEDAEAQRAKLAMLGLEARVVERDQSGRTIHRVRIGPYDKQTDAEGTRDRLLAAGVEARLMRAERPPQ
jgi:cell division protein FtsN